MQLTAAPFHADLAEGPLNSRGYWATCSDGLRLRLAHFPSEGDRGTILLFPGRTEYVEKYGRCAAAFAKAGYHTLAIDWRGQGLADRILGDVRTGHVRVFDDYQRDVEAMVSTAEVLNLPGPRHLLAHSMGGCIGLRALHRGLPVKTSVFTGPMWGIALPATLRPAAWAICWSGKQVGLGHIYAPGTGEESHVATGNFDENELTTDVEMWDYMRRQVLARPELQLGGPSITWVHEALKETSALAKMPSPDLPCLTYLGTGETIVDPQRIRDRMAHWPGGELRVLPGKHELLMEGPDMRALLYREMVDLFNTGAVMPETAQAHAS